MSAIHSVITFDGASQWTKTEKLQSVVVAIIVIPSTAVATGPAHG